VPRRNLLVATMIVSSVALCVAPMLQAQEMPPAASSTPKSHRMPMMYRLTYRCDGGTTVKMYLRGRNARMVFAGKSYAMKQVEAASGTRYSDGSVVWWSKGEEGFLEDDAASGKPVRLAENCKLRKKASASGEGVVSGTVAYRERIAMPENAVLTMQLQDVTASDGGTGTQAGGAESNVIAEQKFTFAGHQVPLPFELHYDPAKIDATHLYALSARITVADQLMFMNTTAYRVITQGNPAKADLTLQMVEGQTDTPK
jgi:putative lipoprotein